MDSDEKRLKQEDCNEDEIGTGVLTLTNKRIASTDYQILMLNHFDKF